MVGVIQATEAIKWILGQGESLKGRLMLIDALRMSFTELGIERDPACVVCGARPTLTRLIDYDLFCGAAPMLSESDADVDARSVKERIDRGERIVLLDVREPAEWDIAAIEGSIFIPLSRLEQEMEKLDRSASIVALCHHGLRSLKAVELLKSAGFERVENLRGGIDAWAAEIDPSLSRY